MSIVPTQELSVRPSYPLSRARWTGQKKLRKPRISLAIGSIFRWNATCSTSDDLAFPHCKKQSKEPVRTKPKPPETTFCDFAYPRLHCVITGNSMSMRTCSHFVAIRVPRLMRRHAYRHVPQTMFGGVPKFLDPVSATLSLFLQAAAFYHPQGIPRLFNQ